MTVTLYKWSIEDWHQLVDSGVLEDKNVELLNGDIVTMSPEREEHSYTNDDVAEYLRELLRGLAKIRESHPITLDNSEPEPDIAIARLPKTIYLQHHPYAEDIYWLVEISNATLNFDLNQKADVYAQNLIQEYWVIDLQNNKVIVHTEPNGGKYQRKMEYTAGIINPVAFPELKVELDRLLLYR